MATFDQFYAFIRADVPGCPSPRMKQALLLTAIDFCDLSEVWRFNIPAQDMTSGQSIYPLTAETDARVSRPQRVLLNKTECNGVSEQYLDARFTDWEKLPDTKEPRVFISRKPGEIEFVQTPNFTHTLGLEITTVQVPAITALTLPDLLYTDYLTAITDGVLARLKRASRKDSWFDSRAALTHQGEYLKKRQGAFGKTLGGNVRMSDIVAPRSFVGRLARSNY